MIYVKCTKCNIPWNVSVKADLSNYVCPVCRGKRIKEVKKKKGVVNNVLIRNRKKFQSQG